MKKLPIFIVLLFTAACSSSYTPTEEMLALKKNMTPEQAEQLVQTAIRQQEDLTGTCGSRGFWYDKESNMLVYKDKISMLAHKRGKQLRKISKGISDTVVFEKQYYEYDFEFNKLSAINIYENSALLPTFPGCSQKELKQNYLIVDLYADELNNLKFIVLEKDFDKIMAALSILLPDKPVKLK